MGSEMSSSIASAEQPLGAYREGDLRAFERRVFSQNGEDGMLEEVLRRVGVETRYFVEFGVQSGIECNCARLVFEERWRGTFLECDTGHFHALAARYRAYEGVTCAHALVTSKNIENLLAANQVPPHFDVLS